LLPLSATTAETKTVSRVYSATTSVLTKKEPTIFIKDTTHRFSQISSAQINKNDNNMLTLTLLTLIIYFIY